MQDKKLWVRILVTACAHLSHEKFTNLIYIFYKKKTLVPEPSADAKDGLKTFSVLRLLVSISSSVGLAAGQ